LQSYATQQGQLRQISSTYHIPIDQPLTEHNLCLVVILYARTHKPTTVPQFVAALSNWQLSTWNVPLPRHRLFDTVTTSLRNYYGNTNVSTPKAALTMLDLVAIHRQLDCRYFEHARDWCACLLAFFGVLRVSEYTDGRLLIKHVQPCKDGLDITVMYSKTSHAPVRVSVAARADILCPLRALLHYRDFLTALRLPASPDDPLFIVRAAKRPPSTLNRSQFIAAVRGYLHAAFPQRDVSDYATHSFRRGGTSALILAGVHPTMVQAHGRWSSQAYQRYFDSVHSQALRLAATRALAGPAAK
jgi:hypothetical protein